MRYLLSAFLSRLLGKRHRRRRRSHADLVENLGEDFLALLLDLVLDLFKEGIDRLEDFLDRARDVVDGRREVILVPIGLGNKLHHVLFQIDVLAGKIACYGAIHFFGSIKVIERRIEIGKAFDERDIGPNADARRRLAAVGHAAHGLLAFTALSAEDRADYVFLMGIVSILRHTLTDHVLGHVLHGIEERRHLGKVRANAGLRVDAVVAHAGDVTRTLVLGIGPFVRDRHVLAAVVDHVIDVARS